MVESYRDGERSQGHGWSSAGEHRILPSPPQEEREGHKLLREMLRAATSIHCCLQASCLINFCDLSTLPLFVRNRTVSRPPFYHWRSRLAEPTEAERALVYLPWRFVSSRTLTLHKNITPVPTLRRLHQSRCSRQVTSQGLEFHPWSFHFYQPFPRT